MEHRSSARLVALRLACTLLAFVGPATAAHAGFVPISQPDAAYLASTTKLDIPPSATPVSALSAADLTVTLSAPMNFLAAGTFRWGTPPNVEDPAPPALGFGFFGASSRVLTFSVPLETFGVEMGYNLQPFFGSFNLTAEFFHDTTLVGTISRRFSAGTGALLFAATDIEQPFTSVRLSAPSASQGFLIADVRKTVVPEPSSLAVLAAGLAGWMGLGLRRGRSLLSPRPRPRLEALEDRCVPSAGDLDPAFGTGGVVTTPIGADADAYAVAVQPDGKILAGGTSVTVLGRTNVNHFTLARYTTTGGLDSSFGSGGKVVTSWGKGGGTSAAAFAMALYPNAGTPNDGKIILAGAAATKSNGGQFALARYNANGSLDTSFGSGGTVSTVLSARQSEIDGVAIQPDGKIVAVGYESDSASSYPYYFTVARYNTNGTLDTTFGSGGVVISHVGAGNSQGRSVALQGDGKIVVGGVYEADASLREFAVFRFNANGTPDASFGGGTGYTGFAESGGLQTGAYSGSCSRTARSSPAATAGSPPSAGNWPGSTPTAVWTAASVARGSSPRRLRGISSPWHASPTARSSRRGWTAPVRVPRNSVWAASTRTAAWTRPSGGTGWSGRRSAAARSPAAWPCRPTARSSPPGPPRRTAPPPASPWPATWATRWRRPRALRTSHWVRRRSRSRQS